MDVAVASNRIINYTKGANSTAAKTLAARILDGAGLHPWLRNAGLTLRSRIFPTEQITIGGQSETIVRGNRSLFQLLPNAFKGVEQIGVIGWGSQGPAQAQNLRESLQGTKIRVKVGLRPGSRNFQEAEKHGFTEATGTLGPMMDVIRESDLCILLIPDAALAMIFQDVFKAVQPGCYLGLSHGFLLAYLKSSGMDFPKHCGVIAVCPKGVGPSVRRLYEQGKSTNGAGINSSVAIYQAAPSRIDRENVEESDALQRATDIALGWSIAIGSPVTFPTTLQAEYVSDLFGERGILLGGVHGICEALFRHFTHELGMDQELAYKKIVGGITGRIARIISKEGLNGVASHFQANADELKTFQTAFSATYRPALEILAEIYEEVTSGREVLSIVDSTRRLQEFPFHSVEGSQLWKIGSKLRNLEWNDQSLQVDPVVAGVYLATMVAQCDLLMHMGHAYSEVANESIIEAVDSLIPYMKFKGVSYMIDNCSTTARLGARKWAPRFDYIITQQVLQSCSKTNPHGLSEMPRAETDEILQDFAQNRIHEMLRICSSLRPPVDIVPQVTHLH